MQKDYVIYPSMIGTERGAIQIDGADIVLFDESHPLTIPFDRCHELNLCVWYLSPLWQLKGYPEWAIMGEDDKWAGISGKRFKSIVNDTENNQIIITVQGLADEGIGVNFAIGFGGGGWARCFISGLNNTLRYILTTTGLQCG
jgi:hypothetical protein